jgi:rubrerythrin
MSIKGTQTEKNLLIAFTGESQARNKYTYFASAARKEGYEQIAAIFEETANQEKEHAKRLFKFLHGGEVAITTTMHVGPFSESTAVNLQTAADGEEFEYTHMYPEYAAIARQEGFKEIADVLMSIAVAEKQHAKRYLKLLSNIKNNLVFKLDQSTKWSCRNCGYVHEGKSAPHKCPACAHPQAHFELLGENW